MIQMIDKEILTELSEKVERLEKNISFFRLELGTYTKKVKELLQSDLKNSG